MPVVLRLSMSAWAFAASVIGYSPPTLILSLPSAIQLNSCAVRAEQFGRMDAVEEGRVADLDALRQRHDVKRPGTTEDGPIPADGAATAENIERSLKGRRAGAVIDDVHTLRHGSDAVPPRRTDPLYRRLGEVETT